MDTFIVLAILSFVSLTCTASVTNAPSSASNREDGPSPSLNEIDGWTELPQGDVNKLTADDKDAVESDVYWRQWKGKIPQDAVVGATVKSDCGKEIPIYMAQAFFRVLVRSGILPSQMTKKSKAAVVTYGRKEFRFKDNIKILCAEDPSILTWVPIEEIIDNLTLSINEDCVIAGNELSFNLFFGRTNYEDETIIGKVVPKRNTMYFPYYGEEKHIKKDFEILCYKKAIEARRIEAIIGEKNEKKEEQVEEEEDDDDDDDDNDGYIPDIE